MVNFKNKKVLVTGGGGFVGSHLIEALIKLNAAVYSIDLLYDKKSYLLTEKLDKKITPLMFDICNYQKLKSVVQKNKIEYIFHLAAQAIVETAYKNPKQTLENNIIGTINIMELARTNNGIKGVIVASSDKSYGDLRKTKYKESDPLFGDHPYEVSKSATDLIALSYWKTYLTPVVVTRFGNIYGEGDLNCSRLIPGIFGSIVKNKTLEIRSNGKYIRDFLYVKDVVSGYLLLAKNINKAKGEAFNFGSNETYDVIETINKIEKSLNMKIRYKIMNTVKNEIPYQSLDYSKIKKAFGWKPEYSISKTSRKMLNWYRNISKDD